ncbi:MULTISPECIES: NAD(P)-dependent oxidoreductase [unclassified Nocardioides]|uniref:NAD(P)-dependent oxidoreductase n=1 Tax=unclassified Nocardioides TaxID=2615069 RepID=UPI0006FCD6F7|nr:MULTISPECIES: NAD(P)-dependent oxidoreductase [unclassified Nocardioides]KRA30948.1 3-hydroxyisobutyrate dehydrogenase [Nocardioides sp. Root614]KRA87569.1 3-hydroxyisobutyrate dehydrogenase [Nocardioides sp. Root682]
MTTTVGFVGLGNIGKPMALRLAAQQETADLEVWVYDVAPDPLAEAERAGARVAESVAALAAKVDVLCLMVRDDDQVRQVLGEALGVAGDRLTVVIHSTVAPNTPAELATTASRHGVQVLDAPVSGGAMGAADGSLALMVGGADDAFAAAEPVLHALGSKVVHAGPIGAGTKFKLARNMMHFIAFTAATEAQRLAEAAGLDLKALGDVVRHTDAITGGPGAIMHRETAAPLDPADFWHGVFTNVTSLGVKDLGFAIDLAHQLGVDVPLAELAIDRLGPGLGLEPTGG